MRRVAPFRPVLPPFPDPTKIHIRILVNEDVAEAREPVHAGLDRLADFDAFLADVDGWLTRIGR